jgi:hypothetical protein
MPTEELKPGKDRDWDQKTLQLLRKRILTNCSPHAQEAFEKWWNHGTPITGFIKANYTETDPDGNELTWEIKDGYQYVKIEPSEDALIDQWKNQLSLADLYSFRDVTLDSLKDFKWQEGRVPLNYVLHSFSEKNRNVTMYGPPGTGKTALACAVGREAKLQRRNPRLIRWHKFLSRMRTSVRSSEKEGQFNLLNNITRAPLLIIDELGMDRKMKASDFEAETLFEIVSGRHGNHLPTMVTTNLTRDQIERLYGRSLADRLYDTANVILSFEKENNYRQNAA